MKPMVLEADNADFQDIASELAGGVGKSTLDLLFVCSPGGHLAQLATLKDWWSQHQRRWVTFNIPGAIAQLEGEDVSWAHHPTTRNARNALRNAVVARRILRERRPDVLVSTGAGVAVPFFLIARLMGIPTVFIEVYDRLESPTLTGRLCKPLSTRFCVQWKEQLELYPEAELLGSLF